MTVMGRLQELVVEFAKVAVMTKVVVGVNVVGVPLRVPVDVEKLIPAGSVPVIEYDVAEKPGTTVTFMATFGVSQRGLFTP